MFGRRRVFLFVVVAVFAGSLPALAGSSMPMRPAPGQTEVVVLLEGSPAGQDAFVDRLLGDIPQAKVLAVPDGVQRPDRRVATDGVRRTAVASGCGRGLSKRPLLPTLYTSPGFIGAPALWGPGLTSAGNGIKIGIIDDGLDRTHPFFRTAGYRMPPGYPKGQRARTRLPR